VSDTERRIADAMADLRTCDEHTRTALQLRDGEWVCPRCEMRAKELAKCDRTKVGRTMKQAKESR